MPSSFEFSRRTDWELTSNRLNDELERLRSQKVSVIDLTESNPTRCGFSYPAEILTALNNPDNLKYVADSKGMRQAREEVAKYYTSQSSKVDPESIILTSSTSEAYTFLLQLLVNPQERVLIARPSYPLFQYLIELSDAQYDFYPLVFDPSTRAANLDLKISRGTSPVGLRGRWRIDLDALEDAITPTTRAIILVNPNNPTGSFSPKEELKAINVLCRKHQMAVISDEVFFDYRIDDKADNVVSLINNTEVPTFVLGGLSKSLGLPQMKLSWIVASGPQKETKEALARLEMIADTFLSVNTPVQNALAAWFSLRTKIQQQILDRIRRNHDTVLHFAQMHGIECLPAQGGWYAVLKIPSVKNEEEWILDLLRKKHVLVHPGYFFDFQEEGHVVISLLTEPGQLMAGLQAIV